MISGSSRAGTHGRACHPGAATYAAHAEPRTDAELSEDRLLQPDRDLARSRNHAAQAERIFFFVADSLEMLLRVGRGLLVSEKLTHTDLAVKVRVTKYTDRNFGTGGRATCGPLTQIDNSYFSRNRERTGRLGSRQALLGRAVFIDCKKGKQGSLDII